MAFWTLKRVVTQPAQAQRAVVMDVLPERHDGVSQWSRVEQILHGAIASAEAAKKFQTVAATQLDAAAYALGKLITELSAVMTLPAPAHTAEIHQLAVPARATAKTPQEFHRGIR